MAHTSDCSRKSRGRRHQGYDRIGRRRGMGRNDRRSACARRARDVVILSREGLLTDTASRIAGGTDVDLHGYPSA